MAPRRRLRRDPFLEPPSASSSEVAEESEEIIFNQKSTNIVTGGGQESEEVEKNDTDEDEDVAESDEFAIQEYVASPSISNKPLAASTKSNKKSHLQAAAAAAATRERKENRKETPKMKDNTSNGEEKSAIYWSLDDEIAMLEGMIDYQQTKGGDPLAKSNAASFYDFIKKKLPNHVSKAKMMDKIKRLKKKYHNIAEDPVSSKPHELSKEIWGGNVGITNGSSMKQQRNVEGDNNSPKDSKDFWAKYPLLEESLMSDKLKPLEIPVLDDVHFVKETMSLIGSSKASEMEGKWKKLKIEELELKVKKLKLIHHQTQLMQEAFKSSS